ncbi:MAG: RDD family protein [Acidobacteriota bacterium]
MLQKAKDKVRLRGRHFHAHETARFDELSGLPLATFKQRAMAISIDFMIVAAVRTILHLGNGGSSHESESQMTFVGLMVEGAHWMKEVVESVVYFGVLLKLGKGQTPGKKVMKIRVLSLTHHELSWWQSIERALGYGASLLEGGFGFMQFFLARNQQCVHDRIAETIVVDVRKGAKRLKDESTEPEQVMVP